MEALKIPATDLTPEVCFDPETDVLKISGKSLPEDARSFFQPLQDWLSMYAATHTGEINLSLNLTYFNSSSAKQIIKILYLLEDLTEKGYETKVTWMHKKPDTMMQDRGEELATLVTVPFIFEVV